MTSVTTSRLGRLLGYDGVIATLLLSAFRYFLVSLCFVACLAPLLVFHAMVGWQPTHLSLVLGAAALLPLAPALHALLRASAALLDGDHHVVRTFWRGFADAVRVRWGTAVAVSVAALVLGYDVALLGAGAGVLLGAVAAAGVVIAVVVAGAALSDSPVRGAAFAAASVRIVMLRPHLALVWLLLGALGVAATTLPMIGAVAWLSAPALAGVAAVICNRSLGFETARQKVDA
ncbi:hypothetical protein ACI3KS_16965 [Microbacterium sp. ZW T5_45]|uniref:hypothetical protein n=1 Tax=Microbacterium sp. ZW T5_45 TaxID=3378080 RepID=UPI00385347C0